MKSRKFWNWKTVKNQENEIRVLTLNGVIASESWFDDDITPGMFFNELNAGSGDIEVFVNSPGGDCVAASQIYTMLNEYKGNVTIKIDGIAASAASVIAMAGTKTMMSPTSIMMIHNPLTIAEGNVEEFQKAIQMLNEVKESIVNAYELKTGLSRAKISHLMDNETWLSPGKALELGFIDEIMYTNKEKDDEDEPDDDSPIPSKENDDDDDDVDEKTKNFSAPSFSFSTKSTTSSLISKVVKTQKTNNAGSVPAQQLMKRLNLLSH